MNVSLRSSLRSLFRFVFPFVFGIALAAALVACTPDASTDDPGMRSAAVDDAVRAHMNEYTVPGLSLAVVQDGQVVKRDAYGLADRAASRSATNQTIYQLASVTKTTAGVGVMRLVERGVLALDDSIHTHLSDLPDPWRGVTLRHVLSHTSGLPSMLDPDTGDLLDGSTTAEAFAAAAKRPLQFDPGARWAYTQINYYVAQRIVEQTTGQPWEAYAHEHIFAPAGMSNTFFLGETAPDSGRVATAYRVPDRAPEPFDFDAAYEYYVPAAAGLFSTTGDLVHLVRALRTGALLSPDPKRQMWTAVDTDYADAPIAGYGIGWTVDTYEGHRRVWHSGGGKATVMHYPDDALSVIVLTNRAGHDVNALASAVTDIFLPED